ncbi:MAG: transcription antitermination factor NusB [Thomasclavelia sp.]|nr:transcription antitermination factor NusB [Thomasclavelia sp.]
MEKIRKRLVREKAIIGVYQFLISNCNKEDIANYLKDDNSFKIDGDEYNYCLEMINNTIINIDKYSNEISKYLKSGWTMERITKIEQAILLVACYEYENNLNPKTVIINEAVEITKKYSDADSYKFINGVLNNLING